MSIEKLINKWKDEAGTRRKFTQDPAMKACLLTLESCTKDLENAIKEGWKCPECGFDKVKCPKCWTNFTAICPIAEENKK